MTAAVTSHDCLRAVASASSTTKRTTDSANNNDNANNTCNVCGLLFYPLWTFLFPGNFFTAHCTYVQQLLPPHEFVMQMQRLVEQVRRQQVVAANKKKNNGHGRGGSFTANLFPIDNPGNMGLDRYAAEHWIGSHPSIRPCDMSVTEDILYWRLGGGGNNDEKQQQQQQQVVADPTTTAMFHWSMAPRKGIFNATWYRLDQDLLAKILANETLRKTEYFLLGGHLWKWSMLYGDDPKPAYDSWIWDWFPDGKQWRDHVYSLAQSD